MVKSPSWVSISAPTWVSISVVILYVLFAIITVGSVSFDKIGEAQEYVLAVASDPMLGKIGFTIISITALIALLFQQYTTNLLGVIVVVAIFILAYGFEYFFKRWEKKQLKN